MSKAADSEPHPETTEQTETIPIVDLEPPLALPPPPPEDEWGPIPERTKVDASPLPFALYGTIPAILGVCSLLLLVLCGFFGYQYFQSVQSSESKLKSLNQWIESFQNRAETFLQVQKVLDENKENLEWLRNQNEYLIEALEELKATQGDRCGHSLNHWVQYRDHCYHQTVEMVSWLNCSDLCVSLNATFLKTQRSKLTSIMKLLAANHTWLGLSYKEEDNKWKWEDGSFPSPELHLLEPRQDFQGKCVYINAHTIGTDNCTRPSSCMCEKAAPQKIIRRFKEML
ncbi:C-type lectin domain family 12 member B-like [Equus asinus]|uniref:C-type lectin domain family 12 member B-like n=1 Tax=Equus asinus TaxID=9793 RepID=UPI0038F768E0